jgi:hypothetical protein
MPVKVILTQTPICQDNLDNNLGTTTLKLTRKNHLHCSFCGKPDSEVGKLLAGPKVFICDTCVGACNRILDTLPETFAGWDTMTDAQLLAALKPAASSVDVVRSILQAQVNTLRQRGVSWEVIGGALGISRQAAWERFS